MKPRAVIRLSILMSVQITAALSLLVGSQTCAQSPTGEAAQSPQTPTVRPAIDGILEAFGRHPLVAISDWHGLAQQLDFYAALVRDPRFARDVGNVVVEFGCAAHQETIDRYVMGEKVAYEDLRKVWTDPPGWTPFAHSVGYANFYAQVRLTNLTLPRDQRIRVWLGDPPIDWGAVNTPREYYDVNRTRDSHAAEVIAKNILAKDSKALVIYGGFHFARASAEELALRAEWAKTDTKATPAFILMAGLVEATYPNAFFFIGPYIGSNDKSRNEDFEKGAKDWPVPALVTGLRGSTLEDEIRRLPPAFPATPLPATMPQQLKELLRTKAENALLGPMLYLGPAASLTESPIISDFYLDPELYQEMSRRTELKRGEPYRLLDMSEYTVSPRKLHPDSVPDRPLAGEGTRMAAFNANDKNGDGKLDKLEFWETMRALGISDRLDANFVRRDVNKDHFISTDEFKAPEPD